ncbi:MAG TPA: hypothetical protein VME43_30555 [Bryobacteraceae bacterium]|nr:hypothetical protein [Bryobacteraceae bacterium]
MIHVLAPRTRVLRPSEGDPNRENAIQQIARLVNMRWLSVHRAPVKVEEGESASYESTVDIKLAKLSAELVKYASVISNKLNRRLWQFFDTVFLSLLDQPSFVSVSGAAEDLNFIDERQTMGEMFQTMWLEREQYEGKMDGFLQMLERAVLKQKDGQELLLDEVGLCSPCRGCECSSRSGA